MKNLGYQPHIDGLRAFAIAFVMIYHTGLDFLPGGFIGVDIFFVLSGFLITSYIYTQLQLGAFRFGEFYIRRVRRLIPAFLVVSVATLVIGLRFLLPVDLIYHAKLIGLSFLSIGNFYLANTTDGYFSRDVEEIPLLHMWSLSVEEQFYILWPILLILAFKFLRKHVVLVAVGLFVAMVCVSEWHVRNDPTRAFYLISTRAHELLIGAMLALVWERRYRAPQWLLSCLSLLSFAVLFVSAIFVESSHEFLGVSSVWVCVATAMLIYAGADNNVFTRFLRMPLLTGLGKISYSLYLWHWPLFAFYHYSIGEQTLYSSAALIAISVLLSTLTWYFVEQPVRKKREKHKITWLKLYIVPVFVLAVMYVFVDKTDGVRFRFGERAEKIAAIESLPPVYKNTCEEGSKNCKRVVVMGDSHAMHFGPFLEELVQQAQGYKLHSEAIPVCLPLYGIIQVFEREEDFFERQLHCRERLDKALDSIDQSVKYFVLGGYWSNMDIHPSRNFIIDEVSEEMSRSNTVRAREAAFKRTLDLLLSKSVTPVVIMDNPKLSERILKCSHKKAMFGTVKEQCDLEFSYVLDQQNDIRTLFDKLREKYPQVVFIDPNPLYCNDNFCKTAFDDGMPLYRDADHLNAVASARLGAMYLERFPQPFIQ